MNMSTRIPKSSKTAAREIYSRIIGELRKLGIKRISRQTARNILKEEGI